jgi:hypothetical protein
LSPHQLNYANSLRYTLSLSEPQLLRVTNLANALITAESNA